ncbi:LacI family transcriptional regulator [Faecalicatena sp. AGMB00832]|uniref:LacI family transcriptional regulator n=1 Tax=Faecalicatena faecalis TaxID=2726362 RepID=A0ABS6D5A3_9FIRM|nr:MULTISPECIES: LacI family DNA-binding transcriptional regulator [Faecalicatena]MBU3876638.1 LacI family transcriptional regulator [Faecalicatena faecalis]MCI6464693.1 LacI family transcriptional regulator [Faecalicatena sp.]MDY5618271.1 LacI family DNA-binding transcriptional regulator [Lachnospiraceae bacterium]
MKSSTLKDIAKKLNLSVATVSRAVNNKEYVKEETRKRVLEALEEYNYVPNEVARSLKLQSTKTIAVILPDICEAFFGEIIKGIDQIVSPKGYTIIVADTNEKKENEEKYLALLQQKRIDALVFATVDLSGCNVKKYLPSLPVIFIDNIPELEGIDSVTIDNVQASSMAIDYLLEQGHRRIATIIGSVKETTGFARREGYLKALEKQGIPVDEYLIQYGNYKENDGFRCMEKLIQNIKEHPFTSVYVTSEKMTFGAIKAIREYGLRVPDDISLVGFDVQDKAQLISPSITTVRQPENLIGSRVGELLLRRLEEKDEEQRIPQQILLRPSIVVGQSVKKVN